MEVIRWDNNGFWYNAMILYYSYFVKNVFKATSVFD